jgi:sec-independent protein translocase protein TatB
MFDVSFSELAVIAVVALIVIGPEKLPKVARTLGLLAGRMQRYVANMKSDIEREMQFEDLQRLQQEIKQSVNQVGSELNQVGDNAIHEVQTIKHDVENGVSNIELIKSDLPPEVITPKSSQ